MSKYKLSKLIYSTAIFRLFTLANLKLTVVVDYLHI